MAEVEKIKILLDEEMKKLLKPGIIIADRVVIEESSEDLWKEISDISDKFAEEFYGKSPSEIEDLKYARDLYKSVGIDPTKTRPSSEALLRRVMQNKELNRINNLVDVCNLESLEFLLPIGLYDIDNISGNDITIRLGKENESFDGIRKSEVNVDRRLCISDSEGAFGSPTSDSARTAITSETTKAIAIIFAPPSYPEEKMFKMIDEGARRIKQYCKARILKSQILRRY